MNYPVLQVALDLVDFARAEKIAAEAVKGGADWVEAGTPLIKAEGLSAVRKLRRLFPDNTIVADMKIMDAGRIEVEAAAKAGADIVTVLGAATDETVAECVLACRNYGAKLELDLIGVADPVRRARRAEELGVDFIGVHCAIDEQMRGKTAFDTLKKIRKAVTVPIAVAGGINSETVSAAARSGADILIVGGAITKAVSPSKAAAGLKKALKAGKKIKSEYFVRKSNEAEVREIFSRVSASNVSDAMHRQGDLAGIVPLSPGFKICGRAVTVRTYPGDWSKPVQAIDRAGKSDVIVIDAGGVGPAVWGELATAGARKKGIAGVIVDGAVRDASEIRKLKFPVFSRLIMPRAGEPKGLGEIGVPVTAGGVRIFEGDWIVADDDGVCAVPAKSAVEVANRAMNVLEAENRLRKEINDGSTLGKVTELLKWEKPK